MPQRMHLVPPADGPKDQGRHKLTRFMAMFAYLWAIFMLFEIYDFAVSGERQLPFEKWGLGLINALALSCLMLIADDLRHTNWFKTKPLIVSIGLRSVYFAILFIVIDVCESFLIGAFHNEDVANGLPTYGGGGVLQILLIGFFIAVTLIPFFAWEEIAFWDATNGPDD
jgi:hypothetical protein